jgi:hypothetical protein
MTDANLLTDLIRADVAPELVARVAAAISDARAEGATAAMAGSRSQNASRQARWRERVKQSSSNVTDNVITVTNNVTDNVTRNAALAPAFCIGEEEVIKENVGKPTSKKGVTDNVTERQSKAKSNVTLGSRLSEAWLPSKALVDFADGLGVTGRSLDEAVAGFRDYWRGVPGSKGRKLDWDATFRNRLRETCSRKKGTQGNGKGSVVDAGRELARKLGEARRAAELRSGDSGDIGHSPLRLLPGFGGK